MFIMLWQLSGKIITALSVKTLFLHSIPTDILLVIAMCRLHIWLYGTDDLLKKYDVCILFTLIYFSDRYLSFQDMYCDV